MKGTLRVLVAVLALAAQSLWAHEVRPCYLELSPSSGDGYRVLWKQPTMGEFAVHLVPHLSNHWLEAEPADQYVSNGFLIRAWKISHAGSLEGVEVSIEGLEQTITDVFVRARGPEGGTFEGLIHPQSPRLTLTFSGAPNQALPVFLVLGIEHILSGPDHLLFVLGLLLLVRDRMTLLKTVTGFTVGHSSTLAWATIGHVSLSVPLLNTLIALSILFLAPEVLRARGGGSSFTIRYPWVVALGFGLLHGLGFASGLGAAGLEGGQLVAALLLFNTGVEVGQLGFVLGVLALQRAFRLMAIQWPVAARAAPAYLIGTLGAAWTFQYAALLFGWTG